MERLKKWFNKKLSPEQEDQWFEKIRFIPPEAWPDIVDTLTSTSKFFPTPDVVKDAWRNWLQSHPQSMAKETARTWCDECDGEGIFSIWYQDYIVPKEQIPPGKDPDKFISWHRAFFPCGKCSNWKRQFPTKGALRPKMFYSRLDILSKGWRLTDPVFDNNNNLKTPSERDLGALADRALNKMPEAEEGMI
jgi:hypothetical protein